ncbi:hypothetical protein [Actinomadura roseirufa]|uniref:hypothetical protein n=1 Tax=Actinomadura roseirufa TaxID=2094049 RepID=UPI00104156A1|nr:hypothetical protein [Actinomadura roseirufa]
MSEFERGRGGTGKAAEPSASASPVRRLDVEDFGGVFFLVEPLTRDIRGTLVDLGGGWWRCRTPRGDAREVFVPPWVDEPWRNAAERVVA